LLLSVSCLIILFMMIFFIEIRNNLFELFKPLR
jgi:hypothetical protein